MGGAVMNRTIAMIEALMVVALFCFNAGSVGADWENTLAAAKKEGKVSVITDVTASMRDALTLDFEKKYGIPVESFGTAGREVAPRVAAQSKAGQCLWEFYINVDSTATEPVM